MESPVNLRIGTNLPTKEILNSHKIGHAVEVFVKIDFRAATHMGKDWI